MAMTLEQKVSKKAKPFRNENLKYKKGLAVLILSINEEAVEYSSEVEYLVRVYFKSKASIKRVGDALGKIKFDKKRVLANYERGMNVAEIRLSAYELFSLEAGLNIYKSFNVNYQNHYSDIHFSAKLDPSKPLPNEYKNRYTGSTADSKPLEEYFTFIQESIVKNNYGFLV